MLPILLTWLACTPAPEGPAAPTDPRVVVAPAAPAPAIAFARVSEGATFSLPPTTRPGGAAPPRVFHPVAPFTPKRSDDSYAVFRTPLPVDFHLFLQRQAGARTFGYYEPNGIAVTLDGKPLPFAKWGRRDGSWGYDTDSLYIGLAPGAAPPDPSRIDISWPHATERERSLHLGPSGLEPAAFAQRTVQLGTTSHTGLLLPAPAEASWPVTVPQDGVLATRARILPPAIQDVLASDGATLRVHVDVGDQSHLVSTSALDDGWTSIRADLSAWSGQQATVRFVVDPGATATLDLAFLEDPTLYTPKADPQRVIVAFIDTVRADHLGMYGYERDTTPKLDQWAADATRFDQHRTVAPWTLPSARSAMTGVQPERYFTVPTLADQLAAAGFHTRAVVANAYLSQVFGIHRGFAHYDYDILQPAAKTVDEALQTLQQWPDRDVMVLVQFMEAHLPYQEPPAYKSLFAGDKPADLPSVSRVELVKFHGDEPNFPPVRDYVLARYDQNIRVLDDQVSRLFEAAGPSATTVLFADHGEEFWDHGGFEHGQSLHDELLHVPFVVRSPTMAPGVVTEPTSLLDLTPTVLDAVGLPVREASQGQSLRAVANGDVGAAQALLDRPQGFGRMLYGPDGWGALSNGHKWTHRDGRASVWNLATDPDEHDNIAGTVDRSAYPEALATALGRDVPLLWRVTLAQRSHTEPVHLTARHPEGIADAWKGYDPKGWYEDSTIEVQGGVATATLAARKRPHDTFYLQPKGNPLSTEGLELSVDLGNGTTWTGTAPKLNPAGGPRVVLKGDGPLRPVIDLVYAPVPEGVEVSAYNEELAEALKELGYVDE